ncbi:hypothetical protein ABZX83_06585 [Streptomyces thermoviolaceus]|jgi:hypothetical protein|uniref:Uncharacterized protein n=1 Tax=Streptomyces thermoviolaceus subsp. thermoviolaceus TaxID=66860 RepID=A0ABX0YKZ5_STRTL|nr:hypothetical protein [Streptomyces thermoviolaceus]NJP13168.1 hypothetical protein [Streptomyces thermoviolaceus subsp. thermoviolaceus]WTD51096.1 hypothetical protein OG899_05400 [Streptomyces thermoviolaceus]
MSEEGATLLPGEEQSAAVPLDVAQACDAVGRTRLSVTGSRSGHKVFSCTVTPDETEPKRGGLPSS